MSIHHLQVYTRDELEQIASLCREFDVLCVSDEVYEWLVYDGLEHIRMGMKGWEGPPQDGRGHLKMGGATSRWEGPPQDGRGHLKMGGAHLRMRGATSRWEGHTSGWEGPPQDGRGHLKMGGAHLKMGMNIHVHIHLSGPQPRFLACGREH